MPAVQPLGKHHNRADFNCGVEALNRYLREQAGQDNKKKIAATFVLAGQLPAQVAGYYTLSATSIHLGELPPQVAGRLPRYPLVPATLLGRLAVDLRFRGLGHGELLLVDALKRSLLATQQIGSAAVLVDAKDESAKAFYLHFQFIPLVEHSHRLFLPMAIIQEYFA